MDFAAIAVSTILPFVATAAIDISTGRQLFVDDFLVDETTNVVRHWNRPVKMEDPVVWPGGGATPKSVDGSSGAKNGDGVNLTCATDGGLWWDPTRRKFRLWYQADWLGDICYAESDDGLKWEYPDLGIVPGTNRLFEHDVIDSWNVTPNYAAENPYADWKLPSAEPGSLEVVIYTPVVNILGDKDRKGSDWDSRFWSSPRDERYEAGLFPTMEGRK